jgi:predicted dehydrogenase
MGTKKIQLGILGLGEGRSAVSAALNSELVELKLLCDVDEAQCKLRSKEFGFDAYTLSYSEMLGRKDIDTIAIYTPDQLHARHIAQALEAGKHVICTKPLLNDLSEAADLLTLGQKYPGKVFVGQSSRFFEPMLKQRSDFEQGCIGDLETIEAYYNADHRWFLEKKWSTESSFKWLFGGLSHPVDLIRWYLPDIEEVMGYGYLSRNGREHGLKNVDTMHFVLRAVDGRVARVSGAYTGPVQPVARDSEMSCILRGREGASQADYMDLRYAISDRKGEERMLTWEHRLKHYFRFEGKSHHAGEYQNYFEYFARSLSDNVPARPDLREGVGTVVLLTAMEQSLAEGKPVRLHTVLEANNLPFDLLST